MPTDLITLTLNPSLDLSARVDHVTSGPKLRLEDPSAEPGGGGINVARAVAALGAQVRAIAPLGGAAGRRFQQLMQGNGVTLVPFELNGDTRQCFAVTDLQDDAQYRFVLPGAPWPSDLTSRILAQTCEDALDIGPGAVVVLSGSQPPGLDDSFPQDLARAMPQSRLIIDTSGAALDRIARHPEADARPHVLRMDQVESEALAGAHLTHVAASADFAQALARRGVADCVVVARGAEGSVMATLDQRLHCAPPVVEVASKVGAGDSFTGAFALALAQHATLQTALIHGTAAAASAVTRPGTELCTPADMTRFIPLCQVVEVP